MANRFTKSFLDQQLVDLNAEMKPFGFEIKATSRNGYTAVDLYGDNGKCIRNIECGSPRECWSAAVDYRNGL